MWSGICVWLLGWNSKGQRSSLGKKKSKGTGFSVDRASEPTPAEGTPFEVLLGHPGLTAQMTDDTYQALWFYTPKQTKRRSECQSLSERENVQNVQWQGTRKESVVPDFDLVTVTAYRNVSTPLRGLYKQTLISSVASHDRHSLNFGPANFFIEMFWKAATSFYRSYGMGWAADKSFTTSAWVHTVNFVPHLLSERWLNAQRHSGRIPNISQSNLLYSFSSDDTFIIWPKFLSECAQCGVTPCPARVFLLCSISNMLVTLLLVNKSQKLMSHTLSMY